LTVLYFEINQAKIRIITALDWPSSVNGWHVITYKQQNN